MSSLLTHCPRSKGDESTINPRAETGSDPMSAKARVPQPLYLSKEKAHSLRSAVILLLDQLARDVPIIRKDQRRKYRDILINLPKLFPNLGCVDGIQGRLHQIEMAHRALRCYLINRGSQWPMNNDDVETRAAW